MRVEQYTDEVLANCMTCGPDATPGNCQPVAALKAHVAELEKKLAKLGSLAAAQRADLERERALAEKLLTELAKEIAVF